MAEDMTWCGTVFTTNPLIRCIGVTVDLAKSGVYRTRADLKKDLTKILCDYNPDAVKLGIENLLATQEAIALLQTVRGVEIKEITNKPPALPPNCTLKNGFDIVIKAAEARLALGINSTPSPDLSGLSAAVVEFAPEDVQTHQLVTLVPDVKTACIPLLNPQISTHVYDFGMLYHGIIDGNSTSDMSDCTYTGPRQFDDESGKWLPLLPENFAEEGSPPWLLLHAKVNNITAGQFIPGYFCGTDSRYRKAVCFYADDVPPQHRWLPETDQRITSRAAMRVVNFSNEYSFLVPLYLRAPKAYAEMAEPAALVECQLLFRLWESCVSDPQITVTQAASSAEISAEIVHKTTTEPEGIISEMWIPDANPRGRDAAYQLRMHEVSKGYPETDGVVLDGRFPVLGLSELKKCSAGVHFNLPGEEGKRLIVFLKDTILSTYLHNPNGHEFRYQKHFSHRATLPSVLRMIPVFNSRSHVIIQLRKNNWEQPPQYFLVDVYRDFFEMTDHKLCKDTWILIDQPMVPLLAFCLPKSDLSQRTINRFFVVAAVPGDATLHFLMFEQCESGFLRQYCDQFKSLTIPEPEPEPPGKPEGVPKPKNKIKTVDTCPIEYSCMPFPSARAPFCAVTGLVDCHWLYDKQAGKLVWVVQLCDNFHAQPVPVIRFAWAMAQLRQTQLRVCDIDDQPGEDFATLFTSPVKHLRKSVDLINKVNRDSSHDAQDEEDSVSGEEEDYSSGDALMRKRSRSRSRIGTLHADTGEKRRRLGLSRSFLADVTGNSDDLVAEVLRTINTTDQFLVVVCKEFEAYRGVIHNLCATQRYEYGVDDTKFPSLCDELYEKLVALPRLFPLTEHEIANTVASVALLLKKHTHNVLIEHTTTAPQARFLHVERQTFTLRHTNRKLFAIVIGDDKAEQRLMMADVAFGLVDSTDIVEFVGKKDLADSTDSVEHANADAEPHAFKISIEMDNDWLEQLIQKKQLVQTDDITIDLSSKLERDCLLRMLTAKRTRLWPKTAY